MRLILKDFEDTSVRAFASDRAAAKWAAASLRGAFASYKFEDARVLVRSKGQPINRKLALSILKDAEDRSPEKTRRSPQKDKIQHPCQL